MHKRTHACGLNLIISELADDLIGGVRAPTGSGTAPAAPMQISATLGCPAMGGGNAASTQTRRTGRTSTLRQHAIFGLRGAPVHRLKEIVRTESYRPKVSIHKH